MFGGADSERPDDPDRASARADAAAPEAPLPAASCAALATYPNPGLRWLTSGALAALARSLILWTTVLLSSPAAAPAPLLAAPSISHLGLQLDHSSLGLVVVQKMTLHLQWWLPCVLRIRPSAVRHTTPL